MRAGGIFTHGWRSVREAGPKRLALTALLLVAALLLARFSWHIWVTDQAENRFYDVRSFALAPQVPQDARILLAVYTDQTLINARKRSPLDRGLLSKALRNLDAMGAKAIGIDIFFDQPQDEDDELVATLRAMRTPVTVAYAEETINAGDIVYDQRQYLDSFIARLAGSKVRPGSATLRDAEGVTRAWPRIVPNLPPALGRVMLASAGDEAGTLPGYEGAIRFRRAADESAGLYTSLPIDSFIDPQIIPELKPAVEGRYVLIGGDVVDFDRVETSLTAATGETPPGIAVHADMIAQMLDGARLAQLPPLSLWALAFLVVAVATLTAMLELRGWKL